MRTLVGVLVLGLVAGCSSGGGATGGKADASVDGSGAATLRGGAGIGGSGTGGTTAAGGVDAGRVESDGGKPDGAAYGATGGGCAPTTLVRADLFPGAFAVDATSIYWVTPEASGTVKKMPLSGGPPIALATGQTGSAACWGGPPAWTGGCGAIAVDAINVYWVITDPTLAGADTIMKVPLGGGPTVTVASGQNKPTAIATDGTSVYWAGADAIMKAPVAGGPAVTLAAHAGTTLALDANNVYFADAPTATVSKVPLAGGTVTTIARGQIGAGSVTVDETSIYWTGHNCVGGYGSGTGPSEPPYECSDTVWSAPLGGGTLSTLATLSTGECFFCPGTLPTSVALAPYPVDVDWTIPDAPARVPVTGTSKTLAWGPYAIAANAKGVYWKKTSDRGHASASLYGDSIMQLGVGPCGARACPAADKQVDAANCGACGHACSPITLASGPRRPGSIAADGATVYWTDRDARTVMKVPASGGTPTILASGLDQEGILASSFLLVGAGNVWWNARNGDGTGAVRVMTVPIQGGTPTEVTGSTDFILLAVDATNLYGTQPQGLVRLSLGGGTPTIVAATDLAGPTPYSLSSLAVDATSLYAAGSGIVVSVPLGGGAPRELSKPLGWWWPGAIAIDTTTVFWTEGPALRKVPLGGGSPTVLAGGVEADDIAVRATDAYYVGDHAIMKVPLGGGSPVAVATGDIATCGRCAPAHLIAVDATSVYWMTSTSIMKAPLGGLCVGGVCR
jgi:hypothetical protein